MQGANLVTFQVLSKNVDILVQSDFKGSKLIRKYIDTLHKFLCLTHVFENILIRFVDALVKTTQQAL